MAIVDYSEGASTERLAWDFARAVFLASKALYRNLEPEKDEPKSFFLKLFARKTAGSRKRKEREHLTAISAVVFSHCAVYLRSWCGDKVFRDIEAGVLPELAAWIASEDNAGGDKTIQESLQKIVTKLLPRGPIKPAPHIFRNQADALVRMLDKRIDAKETRALWTKVEETVAALNIQDYARRQLGIRKMMVPAEIREVEEV